MEYLIGTLLAVAVAGSASLIGLDRDRAFYPTVLIIVASYNSLFAVMGSSSKVLAIELMVGVAFALLAVLGFKGNMWLVAIAMAGHGLFDLLHHLVIDNRGVPTWWPGFCAAVDLVLGGWLAVRLKQAATAARGRERVGAPPDGVPP